MLCVGKIAKRHGLKITKDKEKLIDLYSWEGDANEVTRTSLMEIQHPQGNWVKCVVLVCPHLSPNVLLSWVTQKKMYMIHQGWSSHL